MSIPVIPINYLDNFRIPGIYCIKAESKPCTCCDPPYVMPLMFANNATLTDPVLRHHANIAPGRSDCGCNDCPIFAPGRSDCGCNDCPICAPGLTCTITGIKDAADGLSG